MLEVDSPESALNSRTTLREFLSTVNWRNQLLPPGARSQPGLPVEQEGLMMLAAFWQATNWRNAPDFHRGVRLGVVEEVSQEFQLGSMMSQFEWD